MAVRDRRSGQWHRHHWAIRGHLLGSVDGQQRVSATPLLGAHLVIDGSRPLLTTRVQLVGRPDKSAVFWYCSQAWAGEIG